MLFCSCIVLLLLGSGTFSQAISAPERLRVEGLLSHEALLSEAKPRFSFSHAAVESNSYGMCLRAPTRATVAAGAVAAAAALVSRRFPFFSSSDVCLDAFSLL